MLKFYPARLPFVSHASQISRLTLFEENLETNDVDYFSNALPVLFLCLQALEKDDVDGDGALSYPEFMAGRRRGETVL